MATWMCTTWRAICSRCLPHILQMNSPWALVQAPANFGALSNDILVGNFGSGFIMAFDPNTGNFIGLMFDDAKLQLRISGLWALAFGNGHSGGPTNTLYFSAGTFGETYGLFGSITPTSGQGSAGQKHPQRKSSRLHI